MQWEKKGKKTLLAIINSGGRRKTRKRLSYCTKPFEASLATLGHYTVPRKTQPMPSHTAGHTRPDYGLSGASVIPQYTFSFPLSTLLSTPSLLPLPRSTRHSGFVAERQCFAGPSALFRQFCLGGLWCCRLGLPLSSSTMLPRCLFIS